MFRTLDHHSINSALAVKFVLLVLRLIRVVSSVGSEYYFDRVGVAGSSPAQPTILNLINIKI